MLTVQSSPDLCDRISQALYHLEGRNLITRRQAYAAKSILVDGVHSLEELVRHPVPRYGRCRGIPSTEVASRELEVLVSKSVLLRAGETYQLNWSHPNIRHLAPTAERTLMDEPLSTPTRSYDELPLTAYDRELLQAMGIATRNEGSRR